jgi:hypothetical protein
MKSKRTCQGYDPVFQAQAPHSLHPAPLSSTPANNHTNPPPISAVSAQSRRFSTAPISPPVANHLSSIVSSSPRDHTEYPFPRPPEHLLPHINQPYHMEASHHTGLAPYPPPPGRSEWC